MANHIIALNKIDDFNRHMAQAQAVLETVTNSMLESAHPDDPLMSHVEVQTLSESLWAVNELLGLAKSDIGTSFVATA